MTVNLIQHIYTTTFFTLYLIILLFILAVFISWHVCAINRKREKTRTKCVYLSDMGVKLQSAKRGEKKTPFYDILAIKGVLCILYWKSFKSIYNFGASVLFYFTAFCIRSLEFSILIVKIDLQVCLKSL